MIHLEWRNTLNDYNLKAGDHIYEYFEKNLLKFEHSQNAYNKSVDLAELLGLEQEFYHDFAELLKDIILNVIVERQIQLDIMRTKLEDAFDDIPIELSRKEWKKAMKRMGVRKSKKR